jgi:DNA replication licensing factor MCM7
MVDDSDDPAPNGAQSRSKSKLKYMDQLQDVANRVRDEIQIDLNDVEAYEKATSDDEHNYRLVESIERNAHHYIEILSRAVDQCLPPPTRELEYGPVDSLFRQKLTIPASRTMSWT